MDAGLAYVDTFLQPFCKIISEKIKEFLETKHLYQNYGIEFPSFESVYSDNETKLIEQGVSSSQKLILEKKFIQH